MQHNANFRRESVDDWFSLYRWAYKNHPKLFKFKPYPLYEVYFVGIWEELYERLHKTVVPEGTYELLQERIALLDKIVEKYELDGIPD
jgi:hypothetical protein